MADFAFASVVPVASPIQTVATSRLNGCTLRPRGGLNVAPVEAGVNRRDVHVGGNWPASMVW